jgi:hypothetical protein
MPRILLYILLGWLLFHVIKRVIAMAKPMPKNTPKTPVENFVKCVQCGLHIPESESLIKNNQVICNNPKCSASAPKQSETNKNGD